MGGSPARFSLLIAAVAAFLCLAGPASAAPVVWDLQSDFKVSPNQANPQPDSHGNAGVWEFLRTPNGYVSTEAITRDPALLGRYPTYGTDGCGVAGWEGWSETNHGTVGKNMSNVEDACTVHGVPIHWPTGTIHIHPGDFSAAVVSWRSPVSGRVAISGRLLDDDPHGVSDGVDWVVQRERTRIASGAIDNAGSQQLSAGADGASLASVPIKKGERVYLFVGRKAGADHDSTRLDYTITAEDADGDDLTDACDADSGGADGDGDGVTNACDACPTASSGGPDGCARLLEWSLRDDFRTGASKENPSPDSHGNAAVWEYMSGGDSLNRNPASFTTLPHHATSTCLPLESWLASASVGPDVSKSTSASWTSGCNISLPGGAVHTHPHWSASSGVRFSVVRWRSPMDGIVTVDGSVMDANWSCGNGVDWYIDRSPGTGQSAPVNLASGHIDNGERTIQAFSSGTGSGNLASIPVKKGESLYLLVGDPNFECDSTSLDWRLSMPVEAKVTAPASRAFGDVDLGQSKVEDITVTNDGNEPFEVTSATFAPGGTNASAFTVVTAGTTCLSGPVAPGSSCIAKVKFEPAAVGAASRTLRLTHNGPGGKTDVDLTGNGKAAPVPIASFEPGELDFHEVEVGRPAVEDVTVRNTGFANLTVSSASLSHINGHAFTIVSNGCSSAVAPNATCKIRIGFDPQDAQRYDSTLNVNHNGPGPQSQISLTGHGKAAPVTPGPVGGDPLIVVSRPEQGERIQIGERVAVDFRCDATADAHLTACEAGDALGTLRSGESLDTDSLGEKTVTFTARDDKNRTATATRTYTVVSPSDPDGDGVVNGDACPDRPGPGTPDGCPVFAAAQSSEKKKMPSLVGKRCRPSAKAKAKPCDGETAEAALEAAGIDAKVNVVEKIGKPEKGWEIGDVVAQTPKAGATIETLAVNVTLTIWVGEKAGDPRLCARYRKELDGYDYEIVADILAKAKCKIEDVDWVPSTKLEDPELIGLDSTKKKNWSPQVGIPASAANTDLRVMIGEHRPDAVSENPVTLDSDGRLTAVKAGQRNTFSVFVRDRAGRAVQGARVDIDADGVGGTDTSFPTNANGFAFSSVLAKKKGTVDIVVSAGEKAGSDRIYGVQTLDVVDRQSDTASFNSPTGRVFTRVGQVFQWNQNAHLQRRAAGIHAAGWDFGALLNVLGDLVRGVSQKASEILRKPGASLVARLQEASDVMQPLFMSIGRSLNANAQPPVIQPVANGVWQIGNGVISAGGANVISAGGANVITAGGANVISAGGGNVISAGGANVITAGGANVISAGGGNIVTLPDGAKVITAGGANVISAGGGNVITAGGANLFPVAPVISAGGAN